MSELQPPPPPPPPQGGSGGPPRPDWTPTALSASGQASYVGRTSTPDPASENPQGAPAIRKFAPKRSLVPVLVTVVTLLIAAAVVYAAVKPATPAPSPAATSPTPTVSTTPRAGTPFAVSYTNITGVWQITKHQWSARGLDVYVEVSVDTGDLDCMFNALSASGEQARDATPSQLSPNFVTGMIGAGEQRSGWVHLPLTERGTALVFLHTPSQGQVSGIEVSG